MTIRNDRLLDLIWSPLKEDEFIAYGNDLYLFKVKHSKSFNSDYTFQLCDDFYAEVVANYHENSSPKLVAWYLGEDNPNLYAVNLPNNRIQLISYLTKNSKKTSSVGTKYFEVQREFYKQGRQCNHLVWSSFNKNILAAGFDRIRNEHSILVWDVRANSNQPSSKFMPTTGTSGISSTEPFIYSVNFANDQGPSLPTSSSNGALSRAFYNLPSTITSLTTGINVSTLPSMLPTSSTFNVGGENRKPDLIRAIYESAPSETCNSLSWNAHDDTLLAGVNGKSLKIFDLRDNKQVLSTNTKFVNSFCIDPSPNALPYQAASYFDKVVAIWDTRMFKQPANQVEEKELIVKMQWCPTKSGKLAILAKNSNTINIYSVKSTASQSSFDDNSVQVSVDKVSRKHSISGGLNTLLTPQPSKDSLAIMTKSTNVISITNANIFLSNFTYYNFDSNKILIAYNSTLNNLSTLSLSDSFVITWSPDGDLCCSSNLGRVNVIEVKDKCEVGFISQLKLRTSNDYGLKYDIILLNNGSVTLVSSKSNNTSSHSSASISNITPLALSLNTHMPLNSLVRCDFNYNAEICDFFPDDPSTVNIKYLWKWFETVNYIFEKTIPLNPRNNFVELTMNCRNMLAEMYPVRYCGLRILLSELIEKKIPSIELRHTFEERFKVLAYKLCEWELKDGTVSNQFFSTLENSDQFERACCLALLTKNYEQALEILDTASKKNNRYGCLWIALKYFCDEEKSNETLSKSLSTSVSSAKSASSPLASNSFVHSVSFNRNTSLDLTTKQSQNDLNIHGEFMKECNYLVDYFENPYLKAMFNFLINKEDALKKILHDPDLLFQDRIALSVYFMFDQNRLIDLLAYFDALIDDECLKDANLHGILLTGLTPKCIDLFQAYIDKTSDIQTVSLAIIHSPYADVLQSKQAQYWINSYREQLNKFKFWEKRAEFNILKMKLAKSQAVIYSPYHNQQSSNKENKLNDTLDNNNLNSNLSSSSTSSLNFGANLNVTPTHRNGQSSMVVSTSSAALNNPNTSANRLNVSSNTRYQRMQSLTSISSLLTQQQQQQPQSQTSTNSSMANFNLVCNNCGKNLIDKSAGDKTLQQQFSTFGQSSSLNQYSPVVNANMSSTANNVNSTANEPHLMGCLKCAQFLPQCIICLRVMKINLKSVPSPVMPAQLGTNPPLSKSQSIYLQSPNIMLGNNFKSSKNKSLTIDRLNETSSNEKEATRMSAYSTFLEMSKIGNWFSWCQTCKHGGHIRHVIEWFKTNPKCPYLHCECRCLHLDHVY